MNKRYLSLRFICIMCMLFLTQMVQAQTATIRGKVVDKGTKEAIIGASVILIDRDKRTVRGASTDIEGNYSLPVTQSGLSIVVQYLGYKATAPIALGTQPVINFQLESNARELANVVITGTQKVNNGNLNIDVRDLTTAVTTIQAKDLEEMQAASIDQALQGRMPGVDITSTSGDPGAAMQIRIRGTSTLNGSSNPMIVIDNMPYDVSVPSDFNFATSDENQYGQLLNIAPADIKEITVLRDVASTAIWGSRAANGVLMITTKRGNIGKPTLTYTFTGTMQKQPKAVPTLNGDQYSSLLLEEYYNANIPFSTNTNAKQFQYDTNDPYNYYNFSNNTNWLDVITQTGLVNSHNLNINGGGSRARYSASVGYFNNKGTTKGSSLNRINSLINLDYNVSNRITIQTGVRYTHIDYDNFYNSSGAIRGVAYVKMPNQAVYEYDEYGRPTGNYFSPLTTAQGSYSSTYNPLAMAETGISNQLGDNIVPSFMLRYSILPGKLTAQGNLQFNINNTKTNKFLPQIATGRPFSENVVNQASDSDNDGFTIASRLALNYTPTLNDKHSLTSSLLFTAEDKANSGQSTASTNTASSFLQDPSIPSRTNVSGSAGYSQSQTRLVALNLTSQYKFLDRYIVNFLLRGEGNSALSQKNRYTLFPTISGRWRVSGEPFMKGFSSFLDDLSLRLGRGMAGRAPGGAYGFYNNYQSASFSYLGGIGVYPTNMELTDLRAETKIETNVGIDLTLFKSKLTANLDFYKNRTKNQITDVSFASYNGFSENIETNIGTIDNRGWEFNIRGTPLRTRNWMLDLNMNISRNENIIRELSPLTPRESQNGTKITSNGQYKTYVQENNPFGSFYGWKFKGVYPTQASTIAKDKNGNQIIDPSGNAIPMRFGYPLVDYTFQAGDAMYEDINFDGVIDYKDIVYLGNSNPKFVGGGGATITYKGNLKLSAFLTFRSGYNIINGTKMNTTNMYGFNNQSTAVLRRWKKEGDITDIPRAVYQRGFNYLGSDRYVEDGSFVRLRSVTARYTFDRNIVNKIKVKSLSAYFTAEGLLTFTKYTGQDPEAVSSSVGMFSVATDNSTTPPLKQYTLGIVATF